MKMGSKRWRSECGSVEIINGDCRSVLPMIADHGLTIAAVVADPPYGCGKADWDGDFFGEWYPLAKRLGAPVYTLTGSAGVKDALEMVGEDFVDCISAQNLNGMTRGPLGFNNWISCVVSNGKPAIGGNAFSFVVKGEKPDHPSPKPLELMIKLVKRISNPGDLIVDPMMGSGTTGVACIKTGRKFIGIEVDPGYFGQVKKRLEDELKDGPLFVSQRQLDLGVDL